MDPNGPSLPKLIIDTGHALYELAVDDHALVLGRDPNCDVPVLDERVWQFHACIVREGGRFVLADDSPAGTYVSARDAKPQYIQREEIHLEGTGLIRLGDPDDLRDIGNILRYTIIPAL